MAAHRTAAPTEDPVCGMAVDIEQARAKGLVLEEDGREFAFCGTGCFLEFRDDPDTYLAEGYRPSM